MASTYEPPLYDHAFDEDERDRNLLWKQQAAQRAAYRAKVQASLMGDPVAAMMLADRWQAWLDHLRDVTMPPLPDEPETEPPSNQGLNW